MLIFDSNSDQMRLNRNAFSKGTIAEQAKKNKEYLLSKTVEERLEILWYLISLNYGLKEGEIPRLDRTAFSMRKHKC